MKFDMKHIINSTLFITAGLTIQLTFAQSFSFKTLENKEADNDKTTIAGVLSNYVRIESESGNEGRAGKYLSEVCESRGLYVRRFTEENDSYNFAASLYPLESGKPNIVLLNHIDVVSHGNEEDWSFPPYSGIISDGMVWGRGSIDNKGMAIMQLDAVSDLVALSKEENLPFNVTLLSVSAEEVGGEKGAKIISENFLTELNPVLMLGEGGSGVSGIISTNEEQVVYGISVAHKRGLWLRLSLEMHTSGHGSVPPKEYVNKVMIAALSRLNKKKQKIHFSTCSRMMFHSLGSIERGFKGFALRHIGLFKPLVAPVLRKEEMISALVTNTITLTNMSNPPASVNVISQKAEAILDCRLLPETDTEEFISQIQKWLKDERIHVDIINETVRANCSDNGEYFKELCKSIKSVHPKAGVVPILFPAFNDNNFFRSKGIPVYGILPVHLEMDHIQGIHNVDERIAISDLESGRDIYRDFLLRLMNSGLEPKSLTNNTN